MNYTYEFTLKKRPKVKMRNFWGKFIRERKLVLVRLKSEDSQRTKVSLSKIIIGKNLSCWEDSRRTEVSLSKIIINNNLSS